MFNFWRSLNAIKRAVALNVLCFLVGLITFDLFFCINLLYHLNTLVVPMLLLYEWNTKRNTEKTGWYWRFPLAIVLVAIYIYATHIEPEQLQVKEITSAYSNINSPITIVHISDVQSIGIGNYEKGVFERIKAYQPNVVLHTGDLIQTYTQKDYLEELNALAKLFDDLGDDVLKFHVNGDTENPAVIELNKFAEKASTTVLKNQKQHIEVNGQHLIVAGLNLRQSREPSEKTINQLLTNTSLNTFMLLMGHAPDYVLSLPKSSTAPDVCLAGHTHGGQIRLPGIGPLLTLSNVPRDWARGTVLLQNTTINVSAGIGAEHAGFLPSIRFNCPPEFTVIYLLPN